MSNNKKKICVVSTYKADYGRLLPVMRAIHAHPALTLQVAVGTHSFFDYVLWPLRGGNVLAALKLLLWRVREGEFSYLTRLLAREGIVVDAKIPMFHKGGRAEAMLTGARATFGAAPGVFKKLQPDIILIHGDRFEVLPIAMAAAALNIPIAHIEGGDISGTIDESVRHALSKLAHLHFPITEKSRGRLIKMGEDPERIVMCGMTVIDMLKGLDYTLNEKLYTRNPGSQGTRIDFSKPFVFILYHPVTTRGVKNQVDVGALLKALQVLPMQKVILGSNVDAGSAHISDSIWKFALEEDNNALFYKTVAVDDFYRLLKHAAVAVGNSSSFLREAAFLGTPVVLVGDRQAGRERGNNVVEVSHNSGEISKALEVQLKQGRHKPDLRFGSGEASQCIADTLASLDLVNFSVQKKFYE